jgi:predicted metal-dependent HD superfamily phosphohydrolase
MNFETRVANTLILSGVDQLVEAAQPWYKLPTRAYHNWHHANEVAVRICDLGAQRPELLLAAIWHDAVYIPGANLGLNEDASAAALLYEAKIREINGSRLLLVDKAAVLVRGTHLANHMSARKARGDLAFLLDADLSSLACPYKLFCDTQKNIVKEQTGMPPTTEALVKSATFISKFLTCRPYIYHTKQARQFWEALARDNIKRFCKAYGVAT